MTKTWSLFNGNKTYPNGKNDEYYIAIANPIISNIKLDIATLVNRGYTKSIRVLIENNKVDNLENYLSSICNAGKSPEKTFLIELGIKQKFHYSASDLVAIIQKDDIDSLRVIVENDIKLEDKVLLDTAVNKQHKDIAEYLIDNKAKVSNETIVKMIEYNYVECIRKIEKVNDGHKLGSVCKDCLIKLGYASGFDWPPEYYVPEKEVKRIRNKYAKLCHWK